jgi:hypothetical protein
MTSLIKEFDDFFAKEGAVKDWMKVPGGAYQLKLVKAGTVRCTPLKLINMAWVIDSEKAFFEEKV